MEIEVIGGNNDEERAVSILGISHDKSGVTLLSQDNVEYPCQHDGCR